MTGNSNSVGGVERGCGTRVQGGIYAECGMSKNGAPLEDFLLCPPIPIDQHKLGITPVGVSLRSMSDGGATHIFDWVGASFYPNVADFIEEVRKFGLSRRLPKTLDFSALDQYSRVLLLHRKAIILDPAPYLKERIGGKALGFSWESCPKDVEHESGSMCAGLWWEDIDRFNTVSRGWRVVLREMPSFSYQGARRPRGVRTENLYQLAVFAAFPISRLSVIRAGDGSHEKAAELASKALLNVDIVDC